MLLNLPEEILDAIATELHEPDWLRSESRSVKGDLKAFSSICRLCRDIGQAHVFRDIVCSFRYAADGQRWPSEDGSEMLSLDPSWMSLDGYPARTLPMLRDFFTEHPSLGARVRRLRLVGYPGDNKCIIVSDFGDVVQFADNDHTDILLLYNLLSQLPSLQELQLADVFFATPQCYWQAQRTSLPSLTRLLIEYPYGFQYEEAVVDMIACFDRVNEVLVSNLESPEVTDFAIAPRQLHFKSFIFYGDTYMTGQLFRHIPHSPAAQSLRSLEIGFIRLDSPADAAFRELIKVVGPQLEHFGLNVTPRWQWGISIIPDMSPCTALRTMMFRFFVRGPRDFALDGLWATISKMVATCRCCKLLQTITMATSQAFISFCNPSIPAQKLEDELLTLARHIPLSSVRFMASSLDGCPPIALEHASQLASCFPRLVEQKLFEVSLRGS